LATVDDPISISTCPNSVPTNSCTSLSSFCICELYVSFYTLKLHVCNDKVRLKYLKILWPSMVRAIYSFAKNTRSWAHTLPHNPRPLKKDTDNSVKTGIGVGGAWELYLHENYIEEGSELPWGLKG
jgi:hypothetical protein